MHLCMKFHQQTQKKLPGTNGFLTTSFFSWIKFKLNLALFNWSVLRFLLLHAFPLQVFMADTDSILTLEETIEIYLGKIFNIQYI